MATKKKKTTTKKKSGRVGSVGQSKRLNDYLFTVGGSYVGGLLATTIQRHTQRLPPIATNLLQIGLGFIAGRNKHPFLAGAGIGMGTAGAIALSHSTGVIRGIDDVVAGMIDAGGSGGADGYMYEATSGMPNDDTLSGMRNSDTLSGMANSATLGGAEDADVYNAGTLGWG